MPNELVEVVEHKDSDEPSSFGVLHELLSRDLDVLRRISQIADSSVVGIEHLAEHLIFSNCFNRDRAPAEHRAAGPAGVDVGLEANSSNFVAPPELTKTRNNIAADQIQSKIWQDCFDDGKPLCTDPAAVDKVVKADVDSALNQRTELNPPIVVGELYRALAADRQTIQRDQLRDFHNVDPDLGIGIETDTSLREARQNQISLIDNTQGALWKRYLQTF